MNSKRPLVPGFLNRFDKYLLINKPEVWSARTHLVMYFGLLFIAGLAFISFIIPNDPRSASPVFYWVTFVIIISIIALIGWLIYLLRFNVFKRYGNIMPLSRLITFVLYFIAVGIIFLLPLVMPFVESIRANKAYGDEELVNDINAMNIKICQLEYDSLPHTLKTDTVRVVNQLPKYRSMPDEIEEEQITMARNPNYPYRLIDTGSIPGELSTADSSVRLNDTMYVLYTSNLYSFVQAYVAGFSFPRTLYSDFDLYKKIIRNFSLPDRRAVRRELYRLLEKYRLSETTSDPYEYDVSAGEGNFYEKIRYKYELSKIDRNITHIAERKYRWQGLYAGLIMSMYYYATLITALLVFLYRHSAKKTFFLTLLTGVVLTILTTLFDAYLTHSKPVAYAWLIAYPVLFFVISLFSFRAKGRRLVTGIGLNLFVLMAAFFPLSLISYCNIIIEERSDMVSSPNYINFEFMSQNIWTAEIAGLLFLLILLPTYIQMAYRKWYALPEE